MGNDYQAAEYLAKQTDVPFEKLEILGLRVVFQLIKWDWGMRAWYSNPTAVRYSLDRAKKSKEVLEIKYRVIEKTL